MRKLMLLTTVLSVLSLNVAHATATDLTCKQIDEAISANEDFVGLALDGDTKGALDEIKAMGDSSLAVKDALGAKSTDLVTANINQIAKLNLSNDVPQASQVAMDNYKIMIATFENRVPTTLDVAMLDYTGFKLRGLAAAKNVDWAMVATIIAESNSHWTAAKLNIKDAKAIVELGDDIHAGLAAALATKNAGWLTTGAKTLLDSVDLIEHQVKNPSKDACS
jgi:hypothetical protein